MELGTKLLLNDVSDYQRVTCALARELRSEHCYTDYFFDSDDCALVRSNALLRLRVPRRDGLTNMSSSSSSATTTTTRTAVTPHEQQVTSASTTTAAAAVPGRASLLDFLRVPVAHTTSTTRAHTAPHAADGDTAVDMAVTDADVAAAELVYKYGNTVSDGDQMSFVLKVTRLPPALTRALLACAHDTRDGEDVDSVLTVLQAYAKQDSGDAQTLQSLRELLARLHANVNGNGKGNSAHTTPATAPQTSLHMGLVGSYSTTRRVYALPLSCDTHDTRCEQQQQQQQHATLPCARGDAASAAQAASATLLVRVDKTVYRFKEHYELETLPHRDAMTDDKERVMTFLTSLAVKYTPAAESKFVRFVIGNASRRAPLTDVSDVKLRLTSVEGYTELRRNLCSRAAFTLRPWRLYHAVDKSDRGGMAPTAAHYTKTPRHARVRVPAYFTAGAVATTTADDNMAAAGGGGGGDWVLAGDRNDDNDADDDSDDADNEDVVGDYNCRAHGVCTMTTRTPAMYGSGLYKTHESGSGGSSSNNTAAGARDGADDRTGCCRQDKGSYSTSGNDDNEDEDDVINSPHAGSMYSDTAGYAATTIATAGAGGGAGAMPTLSSSSTQCSEEVYDDYYYDGAHEELAQQCSYLRLRCFRSNPPTYELVLKTQQHFDAGHQDNSTCKMQLSEDVAAMLLGDTPSSFVATQLSHNSIAQTLHTALAVHELQHTVHFCTRRLKAPWWASRAQPCNNNNNTTMSAAAHDTPTPTTAARAAAATRTTATTRSSSLSSDDDNDEDSALQAVSKASATAPQMQQQPQQQLQPPRRPQRQPSIDAAVAGSAAEQRALAHGALTSSTLQCFASQPVAATCASGKRSRSEACVVPLLVHLDHTRFVRPNTDTRHDKDSDALAIDVVRTQQQQQQPHAHAARMQTHVCDLYELEVTNIAPDTAPSDVMDELVAVLCSMGVEWQPGTESKLSYYYKLQEQQRQQQQGKHTVQHNSTARVNSSNSTSRTQPYDYTPTRIASCASTT